MGFFKKAELPPAPAAPAEAPKAPANPLAGVENSVMQTIASADPSKADPAKAAQGAAQTAESGMGAVLDLAHQGMSQDHGANLKQTGGGLREAQRVKNQIKTTLASARRTKDPGAMVIALDDIRPLGESIALNEAGKSAWRSFVGDARRAWQAVERASDAQHSAFPSSSKTSGAGFPDICKVPAPPAPFAPVPFPNVAAIPGVNSKMADVKAPDPSGFSAPTMNPLDVSIPYPGANPLDVSIPYPGASGTDTSTANGQDVDTNQAEQVAEEIEEAVEDVKDAAQGAADTAQETTQTAANTVAGWFGH